MPMTRGIPDPEPTLPEKAQAALAEVVAGQSVVRRVILYVLAAGLAISPVAPLAVLPVILLMATDHDLA